MNHATSRAHFVENVFVLNPFFFAWLLYEEKFGLYKTHIIDPCETSMQIKCSNSVIRSGSQTVGQNTCKARLKRPTSHMLNLMLMRGIYCSHIRHM